MANTDGFYVDDDVRDQLKEKCKKRGDKSKLINKALRYYFNSMKIKETVKPVTIHPEVIMNG